MRAASCSRSRGRTIANLYTAMRHSDLSSLTLRSNGKFLIEVDGMGKRVPVGGHYCSGKACQGSACHVVCVTPRAIDIDFEINASSFCFLAGVRSENPFCLSCFDFCNEIRRAHKYHRQGEAGRTGKQKS